MSPDRFLTQLRRFTPTVFRRMTPVWAVLLATLLAGIPQFSSSRTRVIQGPVWSYGIAGDAGWLNREAKELRASLRKSKISRMILPGDNVYDLRLTYEQIWGPWRQGGFEFPIVALGNHTRGYAEEISYFGMPHEYYTKVEGDIRFIVLNSDNLKTEREQAIFLRRELAGAAEKFVFVVFHHPPFTISNRHSWEEKKDFQTAVRPILLEYADRITALIVGHDHIAGLYTLNDLPMIVSGAGGETLRTQKEIHMNEAGFRVDSRWLYNGHRSWVRLDVNDKTGDVWINFVDIEDDRVSCSVLASARPIRLNSNCLGAKTH